MHAVPTSCRARLQPRDFEFIVTALTGRSDRQADALKGMFEDPGGLTEILDQDRLVRAVLELPFPLAISPQLYFYVLVRRSLKNAAIDDVEIADYVAATLALHASGSPLGVSRGSRPETDFTYHIDFIEQMDGISDYDRFFLEVQCGNHFLVLTGLFPRFLEHRADRRGAPGLRYYEGVARQAFAVAGDHPLAAEFAVNEVYHRLADRFSETRRALNRMADEFMFLGS
ncbi:MAG: hypothetical protein KDM63_07720 [Verrucomicrobiae bacterium]|nr:hypothetical protein [Verrucomicrobiae bacterium]